jgi:hypothetical protein
VNASIWNSFQEPEFPACESRLRMLNGDPSRSAACSVSHTETGDTVHGAMVGPHFMRWTNRDAAIALAWLGILPTCANCRAPYRATADRSPFCGARCQLADKHTFDEYETEAAA